LISLLRFSLRGTPTIGGVPDHGHVASSAFADPG